MISEIHLQNFKSIKDLVLKPGRVTVLVGENGSGKSNILEAIAFAAGAAGGKLDAEYLFNRGIRVAEWPWMQSAFPHEGEGDGKQHDMCFEVQSEDSQHKLSYRVQPSFRAEDESWSGWQASRRVSRRNAQTADSASEPQPLTQLAEELERIGEGFFIAPFEDSSQKYFETVLSSHRVDPALSFLSARVLELRAKDFGELTGWSEFLIYAPENTVLRTPPPEGAIRPVGTKGEGLLRLLETFGHERYAEQLAELKQRLRLLGWFDDLTVPDKAATASAKLGVRDKWLSDARAVFDQRSVNEGFLYLLFYFAVLMSWRTPRFFAIDNVDNALNPKLCSTLMRQIVELARKYDKQVICTTHNPAVLDGMNLHDDEQRLFTVQRDEDGHTTVNRVQPPNSRRDKPPMKLSAAFLAGHLGGLPDHF